MSERVHLECVPLGSIVAGPGAPGTLFEVVSHGASTSTVREVESVPEQIEFMARGAQVSFRARRGRRPSRWSSETSVELLAAPPELLSPLRELRERAYREHAAHRELGA